MDDSQAPKYAEPPAYLTAEDYNRLEHFRRWRVQPPSLVYVGLNDVVQLRFWSPGSNSTVNLSLRVLDPGGQIIPYFRTLAAQTTNITPSIITVSGAEGFILSASVEAPGKQRGQVYVSLEIIRGQGSSDQTFGNLLLAGYPGASTRIGYPQSVPQSPVDGRGALIPIVGTIPAAGVDCSDTVPQGRQWILRSARFNLTAAVAVANRFVSLFIDDGAGDIMAQAFDATAIVATQAVAVSFAPGLSLNGVGSAHSAGWVQECRMLPGWRIKTFTVALQAADQFGAPVYMIEEFITG